MGEEGKEGPTVAHERRISDEAVYVLLTAEVTGILSSFINYGKNENLEKDASRLPTRIGSSWITRSEKSYLLRKIIRMGVDTSPELYVCWNFNSYKTDHVVFGLYVYFVRHVTTGVRLEIP